MISKNTKVVVPTQTNRKYKVNEDGTVRMFEYFEQYRFTLVDALRYIVEKEEYYMLKDAIMYNVPLRDRLREVGMEAFVKEMKKILPGDDTLAEFMDDFAEDNEELKLGDFDIQMYAVVDNFSLLGHTIHGLDELQGRVEMCSCADLSNQDIYVKKETPFTPHVGEVYERYPCFDSEDYAYETRTYQNYIVREKPISKDDMKEVLSKNNSSNCQYVREDMSVDLLPMVYYEGEGGYLLVATKKTSKKNWFKALFKQDI